MPSFRTSMVVLSNSHRIIGMKGRMRRSRWNRWENLKRFTWLSFACPTNSTTNTSLTKPFRICFQSSQFGSYIMLLTVLSAIRSFQMAQTRYNNSKTSAIVINTCKNSYLVLWFSVFLFR